jgi:pyruvate formate lyase activating enzyme
VVNKFRAARMKGLVFDIKRFAIHDGPGIRTTVFFKGCPLKCQWCHNPESRACHIEEFDETERIGDLKFTSRKKIGREYLIEELMKEVLKDVVYYDESGGGITCSGGEPLFQPDFLRSFLLSCKKEDLHTTIDTSGHVPWGDIEKITGYSDLFLYDIKLINDIKHRKFTGAGNELILDNFIKLVRKGSKTVVRIPLIGGVNDTRADVDDFIKFLVPLKNINFNEINLLPYHKTGKSKYLKMNVSPGLDFEEPGQLNVRQIADTFRKEGFLIKTGG